MSWTKTETVTQSPDAQGDKVIAESWAINDRDGNAVLTDGQLTETYVEILVYP
ncbi:MAG: hypothetical protein IPK58_22070 [Acidobacteria bacterium]|nr:hypothetical protein [Acidobacteriota bacterium]